MGANRYARFDNKVAIQKIAETVTDDQMVSFFSNNAATGYTFKGKFYTLRGGALALDTDWPTIEDSLWRLVGKNSPGSAAAVLGG